MKSYYALIYLSDIVIFFKTPKIHIEYTRSVLRLLKVDGVTLELESAPFPPTAQVI